ncbi:hypothetical protein SAVERM_1871 [Streptomyces avermitilis MA-4680 = NBRC 14893]|uniref:Aminopeptidase n=1 Tax=Streptomyces avermitilis (strain ATCC 31267 / DSM 46492 / JCM 5070 / NBRC 14893 / NCIMB 12804 / NRRL 8165 / MA-4680) TaxID=227882 RepID=Q82LY9_STRAW|nr:hypothetical protein SAVERM_1871 [Streptomyces avermitilis MA-4680 = NBRC 14893]
MGNGRTRLRGGTHAADGSGRTRPRPLRPAAARPGTARTAGTRGRPRRRRGPPRRRTRRRRPRPPRRGLRLLRAARSVRGPRPRRRRTGRPGPAPRTDRGARWRCARAPALRRLVGTPKGPGPPGKGPVFPCWRTPRGKLGGPSRDSGPPLLEEPVAGFRARRPGESRGVLRFRRRVGRTNPNRQPSHPPEVLHETIEAAAGEGLHLVSDETWRDTVHRPHDTVLFSPAEMLPDGVTVLTDLAGPFLPAGWPAAVARFPDTADGAGLRARVLDVLTALGARIARPVAAAAAYALDEPADVTERLTAAVRLHARVATAAHRAVVTAGALARPPQAGRHLYVDLGPLRSALSAHGVGDAQELEDFLTARLGLPAPGGQRFGDDLAALRVRLSTGPLLGTTAEERTRCLDSPAPLELPHVQRALILLGSVFDDLRDDAQRWEPPR